MRVKEWTWLLSLDHPSFLHVTTIVALYGLRFFLLVVVIVCVWNSRRLFFQHHGWHHRIAGAIHLSLLVLGAWTANLMTDYDDDDGEIDDSHQKQQQQQQQDYEDHRPTRHHRLRLFYFVFDLLLGCLGVIATLTAARNFPHKLVSNATVSGYVQSGTLHKTAIVTQSEMIEHSFYQGLNLLQAIYLHGLSYYFYYYCPSVNRNKMGTDGTINSINNCTIDVLPSLFFLWLVTSPWYFRRYLPVHSFSHNWKLAGKQQELEKHKQSTTTNPTTTTTRPHAAAISHSTKNCTATNSSSTTTTNDDENQLEVFLYRIKKAQYLFYKHGVLHGINLTVILNIDALYGIPYSTSWRTFWILLNTSYVMEFFMQTMVKRNVIYQSTMLWLQRFLMADASLGGMVVLKYVPIWVVVTSLVLNFIHRHHDVMNTMGIAILGLAIKIMNVRNN